MRTSAIGPSDRQSARRAGRGFTLVEVLVVMVILAVLAGTVSLTLPDDRLGHQEAAVEEWSRQAQWAAESSLWAGRPHAWELGAGESRVLVRRDSLWVSPPDPEARPRVLPEGLKITAFEQEGLGRRPGDAIVFRSGEVPAFSLRLESSLAAWHISGDSGGRIAWRRLARQEGR